MPPMERESHESLLNELLTPDIAVSRITEIAQELRTDYGTVIEEHTSLSTTVDTLKLEKDDLVVSNSRLFRQLGTETGKPDKKEEEKSFSETITLESIEGANQ